MLRPISEWSVVSGECWYPAITHSQFTIDHYSLLTADHSLTTHNSCNSP